MQGRHRRGAWRSVTHEALGTGQAGRTSCQAKRGTVGGRRSIIAESSMASGGSYRARRGGVTSQRATVTGSVSINALRAGRGPGVWGQVFAPLTADRQNDYLLLDSPIVRRPSASGDRQKGDLHPTVGRSRGGLTTKIHLAVDGQGRPVHLIVTAGQCHASTQARALLSGLSARYVIADKAYDRQELIEGAGDVAIQHTPGSPTSAGCAAILLGRGAYKIQM